MTVGVRGVVPYLVMQAVGLGLDVLEWQPLVYDVEPDHLVQERAVVEGGQGGWVAPRLVGGREQRKVLHLTEAAQEAGVHLVGEHLLELVQRAVLAVLQIHIQILSQAQIHIQIKTYMLIEKR